MLAEIQRYIKLWEQRCYSDGLPDEPPQEIRDQVPSYRAICMAIMKNDLTQIGIERQPCEYYGMLKAIELNKPYKPKRMTKQEQQQSAFDLINKLVAGHCYIKGYGKLFRVCDQHHNPLKNIDKTQMNILLWNHIVVRNGLIWSLNVLSNPFHHAVEVKLPDSDK